MDQALLPGVGNIQASEALFRARIHPGRPASDLSGAELKRVAAAVVASIRATLDGFSRAGALSEGGDIEYVEEGGANPFAVYDRAGEPCPRCRKATIARMTLGGRGTFYCPRCQKGGPARARSTDVEPHAQPARARPPPARQK